MSEVNNNTPASIDEGVPEVSFTVEVSNVVQAPIDPTLKIQGMAADAKATGDAIDKVAEDAADALDAAVNALQEEIDEIDSGVDSVTGKLFPVGAIYVSTSATAPTFGGTNWRWQEIMLPVTQGDLMDGVRNYAAKTEEDTPGTLHFWMRIADAEVTTA
jgi:hypothetical protein